MSRFLYNKSYSYTATQTNVFLNLNGKLIEEIILITLMSYFRPEYIEKYNLF